MEIKFFSNIYQVKKYWLEIIADSDIKFYQTYCFNKICFEYRISSLSNLKKGNVKSCFAVAFRDEKPICIAPLIIEKNPNSFVSLLGYGTNAGKLDFIYNEKTDKADIVELYNICRQRYKNIPFSFSFVDEKSPIVECMQPIKAYENYAIQVDNYENYFSSLSKSTRQNIRTAYNRLNTDNMNFELKRYDKNSKDLEHIIEKCNYVYQARRLVWNSESTKLSNTQVNKIRRRDIVYKTMRVSQIAAIYVLFINEEIAAFFMGYEYDNLMYIPRLAINDIYGKYSPGYIIINEYLKSLDKEFVFDLGRGEESYKTKLNGKMSFSFNTVDR